MTAARAVDVRGVRGADPVAGHDEARDDVHSLVAELDVVVVAVSVRLVDMAEVSARRHCDVAELAALVGVDDVVAVDAVVAEEKRHSYAVHT